MYFFFIFNKYYPIFHTVSKKKNQTTTTTHTHTQKKMQRRIEDVDNLSPQQQKYVQQMQESVARMLHENTKLVMDKLNKKIDEMKKHKEIMAQRAYAELPMSATDDEVRAAKRAAEGPFMLTDEELKPLHDIRTEYLKMADHSLRTDKGKTMILTTMLFLLTDVYVEQSMVVDLAKKMSEKDNFHWVMMNKFVLCKQCLERMSPANMAPLNRCSACHERYFCCQYALQKDWSLHKKTCTFVPKKQQTEPVGGVGAAADDTNNNNAANDVDMK